MTRCSNDRMSDRWRRLPDLSSARAKPDIGNGRGSELRRPTAFVVWWLWG
ncbi:hypothetical protein HanIR_Chr10g0482621 [Helianthus annuus]|nr:hypothetical protein HanIR_Chr10g0482621 [Helianthus annuus]